MVHCLVPPCVIVSHIEYLQLKQHLHTPFTMPAFLDFIFPHGPPWIIHYSQDVMACVIATCAQVYVHVAIE